MARIKGFRKAINALKKFDSDAQKAAKDELLKVGQEILAQALRNVPLDSGQLQASLDIEVQNNGWRIIVYADAPHAPFQEFGTGRFAGELIRGYPSDVDQYAYTFFVSGEGDTRAQPFLFPPFLAVREQVAVRVEEVLRKHAAEFNRMK